MQSGHYSVAILSTLWVVVAAGLSQSLHCIILFVEAAYNFIFDLPFPQTPDSESIVRPNQGLVLIHNGNGAHPTCTGPLDLNRETTNSKPI